MLQPEKGSKPDNSSIRYSGNWSVHTSVMKQAALPQRWRQFGMVASEYSSKALLKTGKNSSSSRSSTTLLRGEGASRGAARDDPVAVRASL
jgi:hypothetical protein